MSDSLIPLPKAVSTRHYRNVLAREYTARVTRNPSFSLRAFAKQIEIPISSLSEILNGNQGLSVARAKIIAKKLRLQKGDADEFCDMVESLHSRSLQKRKAALARLKKAELAKENRLEIKPFSLLSSWYYLAIVQLTELPEFVPEPDWISNRLGISKNDAEIALDRLLSAKVLTRRKDGSVIRSKKHTITPDGTPSEAIRLFHSQILYKAQDSLKNDPIEDRNFSATLMNINLEQLARAKEMIREFRLSLSLALAEESGGEAVYCLSAQFFRLDQDPKKPRKANK